jgi:hypothetical protein
MEESADETTDFHSLRYSLADEEATKKEAVAEAMRRAIGRANAALEQKGQKVGALRYANLDVRQVAGVAVYSLGASSQTIEVSATMSSTRRAAAPASPPQLPRPKKSPLAPRSNAPSRFTRLVRSNPPR